jgi:hypothetical protein
LWSFNRSQTNGHWYNSGDKITCITIHEGLLIKLNTKTKCQEGQSLQQSLETKKSLGKSFTQTKNIFTEIIYSCFLQQNYPSRIGQTLEFDASDSFVPLDRELKYHWNFGNGNRSNQIMTYPLYHATGSFEIVLTVSVDE